MAKKKRQASGRGPKRRRVEPELPSLPDPRALEGVMQRMLAGATGQAASDTPAARAQSLMYQAFAEPNEQKRLKLAHAALAMWPDCADAYVLLGEHAPSRKEAVRHYEQAVAAGERALGPAAFERDAGHFWGILETRPYMRARLELAMVLWTVGRRAEAVQHLQELLRLNPNDNQGVRYTLAGFLLFLDRDDDLAKLLEQYGDEASAAWAYTKALLAFRQYGDTSAARVLLTKARKLNTHVPAYLTGEKHPGDTQPDSYSAGQESEALEYIRGFLAGWKYTPGAVAWLRAQTRPKKTPSGPQPKGPLGVIKKWLNKNLAQKEDVWQAGIRQLPSWINVGGDFVRPWMVLVTSTRRGLVLAHAMPTETPSAELLWDTLVQAMRHPMPGSPHRPTELQVQPDERWAQLEPHLAEIGVRVQPAEELAVLTHAFADVTEHLFGKPQPGLLVMPGITAEQVRGFYEAAAEFYRQMPWKQVGYESAIRIACPKYEGGPWYGVLMGQSGLTAGLALYEDLHALQRMLSGGRSDEQNARQSVATTVTFGEEWESQASNVDAARAHGWPIAQPDAYPDIFHKERGLSMRPPLAWELELMEGCLRAVPPFVRRRSQDDPAPEELTVPVAGGELKLTLAWVPEEAA